jgi:hypothetical protein
VKETLKVTGGGVKRLWPKRCDGMVPLALFSGISAIEHDDFWLYDI